MNTTQTLTVGDRGRIVLPADMRAELQIEQGDPLHFVRLETGYLMLSQEQALAFLRQRHHGEHLVDELITDRRTAAHLEDVELEGTLA